MAGDVQFGSPASEGSLRALISVAGVSWTLLTRHEKSFFLLRVIFRFALNGLDIAAVSVMGLLGAITASGVSGQQLELFGFLLPAPTAANVIFLVLLVGILFILKGGLAILFARWTSVFLAGVEVKNSAKITRFLFTGPLSRFRKYSKSQIQFLVDRSTNATFSGVLGALTTLVIEGSLFLFIFILFVVIDPLAAVLIALYFSLVIGAMQFFTARRYLESGKRIQQAAVGAGASVLEMVDIFREMAVLGKQDFYLSRFVEAKRLGARTGITLQILKSVPRYVTESGLIIGALLFTLWQLNQGTLGEALLALGVFLGGSMRIMTSLLPLQQVWNDLRVMQNWVEMAQGILVQLRDEPEDFDSDIYSSRSHSQVGDRESNWGRAPRIEFRNVSFTHVGKNQPAIRDVTLNIRAGSTVAIVGPSGAGKTTLVDLLLGLYEPESGEVRVDGIPPAQLRQEYSGIFAYVPQKPGLVSGSIADNVALGVAEDCLDEDLVWASLEHAQLHELVGSMPRGIHSSLGEHSDELSGGQIQRLGLARAMYTSPRLIVLDEATSALDAATEANITEAIASLGSETTVVVIAHRLSTIQDADEVHVMDDGRIVASGTFSQVRKRVPMIEEYVKLMSFDDD